MGERAGSIPLAYTIVWVYDEFVAGDDAPLAPLKYNYILHMGVKDKYIGWAALAKEAVPDNAYMSVEAYFHTYDPETGAKTQTANTARLFFPNEFIRLVITIPEEGKHVGFGLEIIGQAD